MEISLVGMESISRGFEVAFRSPGNGITQGANSAEAARHQVDGIYLGEPGHFNTGGNLNPADGSNIIGGVNRANTVPDFHHGRIANTAHGLDPQLDGLTHGTGLGLVT